MTRFNIIYAISAAFLLTACGDNTKANKEHQTDDVTADSIAAETSTASAIRPKNCTILFDGSTSMKGYVNATINGCFPGVIAELNNMPEDSTKVYVYGKQRQPIADLFSEIQNRSIPLNNESDLFAMVRELLDSAAKKPEDCHVMITDGIMSGSNAQIQIDRTYNISKPELLKGRIDSIVNKIPSDSEISLFVASYSAPFKGTYYGYDNTKHTIINEPRPFYILVAGGTPQVNYVARTLEKRDSMKSVQYGSTYHVGLTTNTKFLGNNEYQYVKPKSDKEDNLIIIDLNIDNLPDYAKEIEYLKRNLEITRTAKAEKKLSLDEDYNLTLGGAKLRVSFGKKTINLLPASFDFRIKRSQPLWVDMASTDNDIKNYRSYTTLNLRYFLAPFLRINGMEYLNDTEKSHIIIKK